MRAYEFERCECKLGEGEEYMKMNCKNMNGILFIIENGIGGRISYDHFFTIRFNTIGII